MLGAAPDAPPFTARAPCVMEACGRWERIEPVTFRGDPTSSSAWQHLVPGPAQVDRGAG
jgi:hypothetical protein